MIIEKIFEKFCGNCGTKINVRSNYFIGTGHLDLYVYNCPNCKLKQSKKTVLDYAAEIKPEIERLEIKDIQQEDSNLFMLDFSKN